MAVRAQPVESPAELDDVTLRRAQRGDHGAFRILVDRYRRPVWELIWRIVAPAGGADRAEDLAQDAFVRVFRALPGFDAAGPARLSTWIFTVATRVALNELRAARARPGGDDAALDALVAAGSPRRDAMARELGERLAAAMAALPAGARAALVLRDVFELEYDAIAKALEIDLGTVKSRIARARAAVRARMTASGDAP